jgi:hypothetical protein
MSDFQSFLDKLIAKSAAGRVPWKITIESDAFLATLGNEFTIRVNQTANQEYAFEMRDARGNKLLDLCAGKTQAWEQGYEEAVENYERLRQLFQAARASALNIGSQLLRAESLLDNY